MNKKTYIIVIQLVLGLAVFGSPINIITTTTDLASIASDIAGDLAVVESIASGHEDPHYLTARPSFITKASKADLWIRVGLELEVGWEPAVLRDSRNRGIQVGNPRHLDVSENIAPLDVPTGQFSRADGDIHPWGNPHYWVDPLNGRIIAKSIADRLIKLYPEHKDKIQGNLKAFEQKLDTKMFGTKLLSKVSAARLWWLSENGQLDDYLAKNNLTPDPDSWYAWMMPYKNAKIATYHRSWIYLLKRFNLKIAGEIEPKPGVPPSARHLTKISRNFKENNVKVILQEPFYNTKAAKKVSQACGATVVVKANCTNGADGIDDYITMLDSVLAGLRDALARK